MSNQVFVSRLSGDRSGPVSPDDLTERTYRKVVCRLLPILFLAYILCTLDRLNIGYAHLQMKADLGLSDEAYGFGAGLFFLTYMAFEVPSSFMLAKIGIRVTILRIMFGWGIVSAGTMFVSSPTQFYVARLLLGVCEAGFFPAIIYYISCWLPPRRRGRVIAAFMMAIVISSVIGGPVSGLIMDNMQNVGGLRGWQWLFLLEGLPSCVVAVVAYFRLADTPDSASFLAAEERDALKADLAQHTQAPGHSTVAFKYLVRDWRVYSFAAVFFLTTVTAYGLSFWGPAMVHSFGVMSVTNIGITIAIPSLFAALFMWLNGRHSDKHLERRWHFAIPAVFTACSLLVVASDATRPGLRLVAFGCAIAFVQAAVPIFWTMASTYLSASVAATGIAFINTLAVFSGFVTPWMLGFVLHKTGSHAYGAALLSVSIFAAAILMLFVAPRNSNIILRIVDKESRTENAKSIQDSHRF